MRQRLRDERLFPWPRVVTSGDSYILRGRVLSPKRLGVAQNLILQPLKDCWRFLLVLLIAEGAIFAVTGMSFLQTSLSRQWIYTGMAICAICWFYELGSRYRLTGFLLAKSVTIVFKPDEIVLGSWPFRKRFSRDLNLNTMMEEVKGQKAETAYENAYKICLTCDNSRMHVIAEVSDPILANRFHMNLKTVLELHLLNDYDFDPTTKARV